MTRPIGMISTHLLLSSSCFPLLLIALYVEHFVLYDHGAGVVTFDGVLDRLDAAVCVDGVDVNADKDMQLESI